MNRGVMIWNPNLANKSRWANEMKQGAKIAFPFGGADAIFGA
jgi:hypothetical protein